MKKSLFLAAVASVVTVVLVAGGTVALFSAKTTAPAVEDYQAGTFCFVSDRDDGDVIPGPMFYVTPAQGRTPDPGGVDGKLPTGLWAPGDSITRTLILKNNCTLDGWLGNATAKLTGYDALKDKLNVDIYSYESGGDVLIASGKLSAFMDGSFVKMQRGDGSRVAVYSSGLVFLHFKVSLDKTIGNDFQDKTAIVDFTISGDQMKHNP